MGVLFIPMLIAVGFLLYPTLITTKIINEEKFLEKELERYIGYKKKVKYRLIPFKW